MDNRQSTDNPSQKPTFNRNRSFDKNSSKPFTPRNTNAPRDGQFFKRDNQDTRDTRPGGGNRDTRPNGGSRDSRDNRNSRDNRDSRFGGRGDDQNRPERGGFSGGGRRFNREGDNRFQPKDRRFSGKSKFTPKGKNQKPWKKEFLPRLVSDLQITDGKHRGKYVEVSPSPKIKMTERKIREVMFKILYRRIRARRFLDLCAGGGTVGIEAISRGALLATFVERSARMCSLIHKNLKNLEIKEGHGEVHETEVVPFLKQALKRSRFWDVVYFNPPYDANYDEVIDYFSRGAAVGYKGTLVIEHPAEMFFPEKIGHLNRWRVVVLGDSALTFYERKDKKK